jgi:SAM-dependent methyltransferase
MSKTQENAIYLNLTPLCQGRIIEPRGQMRPPREGAMTFLTRLDRVPSEVGQVSLAQRGRAALEGLGSLQRHAASAIRARARFEFEQAEIPPTPSLDADRAAWRAWLGEARGIAERSGAYRIERFHQRFVAEEIFNRAIPAVEDRRALFEQFFELPVAERLGSLELDPNLTSPPYYGQIEWHLEPGGWDGYDLYGAVLAFALGPHVFRHGGYAAVEVGDDILEQRYSALRQFRSAQIRRIYEPGCGGFSTMAAAHRLYPQAVKVASDLSPLLLRVGHVMAERSAVAVDFKQRDARDTRERDESFDAVIMYALMHEMTLPVAQASLREALRILQRGGEIVISDPPPFRAVSPFQAVVLDWETRHRGEPLFSDACVANWAKELQQAGFVDVEEYALGEQGYPYITRGRKA